MKIKSLWKNIHVIIIFLVSMILISYGIIYHIDKINFNKKAIVTTAKIYQISKNNNISTLYIRYEIDNKIYKSVINTKEKDIDMGKKIKVYCDKNNPKIITDGTISKYGICLIVIGIVILLIDSLIFYKHIL